MAWAVHRTFPVARVVLAAALAACNRSAPPTVAAPSPTGAPTPTAPSPRTASPPPAPEHRPPALIVGTASALAELTREGAVGRRFAAGPALHPRFVRPTEVLALATTDKEVGSAKPVPVRIISLDTGASRAVGTFPAFRCRGDADGGTSDAGPDASASPGAGDVWELSLQTEEDLVVTPDGLGLCLTRLDRNLNMADLMFSQRMDLATGTVESVLVIGGDRCPAPPGVTVTQQNPCRGRRPLEKPAARSFPFRFDRGKIVRRDPAGDRKVAVLTQFTMNERSSPSGRWLLVSRHVAEDEGDYIYRQIALLDLASGQLYPLSKTAGPWPAPFDLARFKPSVAAEQTVTVAGESDLAWLPFAGDDVLVLDNTLVVPERASVRLPGDVAR